MFQFLANCLQIHFLVLCILHICFWILFVILFVNDIYFLKWKIYERLFAEKCWKLCRFWMYDLGMNHVTAAMDQLRW